MSGQQVDLSDPQFRDFVYKLGHDDAFRAALVADPARVLQEEGIPFDSGSLPAQVTLPSKEEIASGSQEALHSVQVQLAIPTPVGPGSFPKEGA